MPNISNLHGAGEQSAFSRLTLQHSFNDLRIVADDCRLEGAQKTQNYTTGWQQLSKQYI